MFNTIDELAVDLAAGKMIVLTDDENRENEGDLVMAAEKVTPEFPQEHFLYVQGDLIDTYKATTDWKRLTNVQPIMTKMTVACNNQGSVAVNGGEAISGNIDRKSVV